jgi:hypothetical protein
MWRGFPQDPTEHCQFYKAKSLCVEIVRCKDCIYYQCEKVLMSNGELRDYTEQEIKEGKCVSLDKGINLGSRCLRHMRWEENCIPVWFNDNDYCSYGKKLKEIEGE